MRVAWLSSVRDFCSAGGTTARPVFAGGAGGTTVRPRGAGAAAGLAGSAAGTGLCVEEDGTTARPPARRCRAFSAQMVFDQPSITLRNSDDAAIQG